MKKASLTTTLILIITLLLSSATYSWMMIREMTYTNRYIEYDLSDEELHSLWIQDIGFSAEVFIYDEENSLFTSLPRSQENLFESHNFIPGDNTLYRVDLENTSNRTGHFRISIKDLSTTYAGEENIFDYFSLMVYRVTGLEVYPEMPDLIIGNNMQDGNMNFYENFEVPANVSCMIYFSIYFQEEATSEFEDTSITIGRIVIGQV